MLRLFSFLCVFVCLAPEAFAQANGKLQIHYMDVGQGDGAVLISPLGEVVLFDNGARNQCGNPIAYLQSLGITRIDYHIASHYHSDHIGCTAEVLGMFPLQKVAYDRGGVYNTQTYNAYAAAVAGKRVTAVKGQTISLDAGSGSPVTVTFAALNGNGSGSSDENDLSLVSVVRFGQFDAEFGGDLSGASTGTIDPDPGEPPLSCSFVVSPAAHTPPVGGGTFVSSVTTSPGCAWSASSGASWVGVTAGTSGVGNGSVTFSVASNGGAARSSAATVAGKTVSFSQSGTVAPPTGVIPTCSRPAGAPATATAVCKNGQYSSSQNRSGTCSSNGGVSCWICPGALCNGVSSRPESAVMSLVPGRTAAAAYADIESSVALLVGRVEVYKVHHHGSRYSSNAAWISTTAPKVGIISVGASNSYGHPTGEALGRLHAAGVRTYWTSVGNGAAPTPGRDSVAGDVVVEVPRGGNSFSVRYGTSTDTFAAWDASALQGSPPLSPAFGSFDTPIHGSTAAGEVGVTGWALDNTGVSAVSIYRSPLTGEPTQSNGLVFLGNASFVAGARPDIAASFPSLPNRDRAGWGYMLLSNMLPGGGNGVFTLFAFAQDESGLSTLLGEKTIVVTNSTSALPFGTIDTPGQGATVSGIVDNFGWVLTPNPATIPIDGSTITVYVDNVPVGHPTYNLFRPDIAGLFPGYANTSGAVGHFALDTTALTDGVHTIAWVVVDSAGNASGIGSRYFTVQNGSAATLHRASALLAAVSQTSTRRPEASSSAIEIALKSDGPPIAQPSLTIVLNTDLKEVNESTPFVLEGWTDELRAGATEADRLEVWVHPLTGAAPFLLGNATIGVPRPDVQALYGERFKNSGYVLAVEGLPAGDYAIEVRGWSRQSGEFAPATVARVRVR